eukprot:3035708-Rhodomonas_salina.1
MVEGESGRVEQKIIGLLFVKDLILLDPDDATPVRPCGLDHDRDDVVVMVMRMVMVMVMVMVMGMMGGVGEGL